MTYFASLCEEGLYTVLRVICVTGSVRDGSLSLDTANKVEWFHMALCWIAHRFMRFSQLASSCLSACPQGKTRFPRGGFLWKLVFIYFSKIWRENTNLMINLTRMNVSLHKDQYTSLITCRSVFFRNRNLSDKCCTENQNTPLRLKTFSE